MPEKGFFNGLFDFDHDGKLDPLERAMDFSAFMDLMEEDDMEESGTFSDAWGSDDE